VKYRSTCAPCRVHKPFYSRGFALVIYQKPTDKILHQIKFSRKPWLLAIFHDRLRDFASSPHMQTYDYLIPVPMDAGRQRERGFNQASIIARMISKWHPDRVKVTDILKKKKHTLSQSQLTRLDRQRNLSGAFALKRNRAVTGKQILLIDDVFTTGSTLNECAKLLRSHGASRVDFLTIARGRAA